MRTQLLGEVEIDPDRLRADLATSETFTFAEAYSEFSCGRPWSSCMLWAPGGDAGDGVITHYDHTQPSRPTPFGQQLTYVRELITQSFAADHLLFARLAVMSQAVLVPHRDYLEFHDRSDAERLSHRLHVPLATSEDCVFMEDDVAYRMGFGEVWFLDAARMHSAAVLSDTKRIHLLLDFADVPDPMTLLRFDVRTRPGIPATSTVPREPLSEPERAALLSLADVADLDTLPEVFAILIKKHFRRDGGPEFVWRAMQEIARNSGDPQVATRIEELHKYYVLERDE